MKNKVIRVILPVAVIATGLLISYILASSKPERRKKPPKSNIVPVRVIEVQPQKRHIKIIAQGTVIPAKELDLKAEVNGRVIKVNPKLIPGGLVKKGEILIKIDRRDYSAAIRHAKAQVAEARARLDQARLDLDRERELFEENVVSQGRLDKAISQHKIARAMLNAAGSALSQARYNYGRTTIKAPFNALVRDEWVEIGTLVTTQTPVAKLIGSDKYWVQVSVPMSQLSLIDLPDRDDPESRGANTIIRQDIGNGDSILREGKVIRLLGHLSSKGRMARLLVEVDDPLRLNSGQDNPGLQLMVDAYVHVEMEGAELENVFVVPRDSIHEGNEIWIMGEDNKLVVREAKVVWWTKDEAFVTEGISPGEKIVTSKIPTPIPGTLLTVEGKGKTPPKKIKTGPTK